ncbi:thioredoxin family protein [Fibrobacter sp. UWEL]|uniref:protein-disulfide reductase DsbD family protein n=1 Tax=Fibrobacter sp. UWEL TaxID=1896209 RepID=UPI001F352912|nr:thioredoxin family protein [Fibrobacter sp. UWEL]
MTAFAQEFNMNSMPPPEMSMEYSAGALKAGSKLTVQITVPDNWHVNANIAADEFLKPSSIDLSAKGITFGEPVWPEAIKEYSEALDMENLVFRGKFQVVLPIDGVEDGYDSLTTKATFHYQACDNSICLAPAEKTIGLNGNDFFGDGSRAQDADAQASDGSANKKETFAIPMDPSITGENTSAETQDVSAGAPSEENNTENTTRENSAGTLALLFFAFVGGLILNLMPCVLPVLSLKLFSLIKQAGESRGRLMVLGASTAAGILASFWTLAAVITAVKIGGGNAGWGMQFQSPGFIAFMVVILSAFAMSFFGVFEVWLPWGATTKMDEAGRKSGIAGAFFTGALLVLLSTPCSAPFLGTAMGFAFTASAPVLFLFFTAAALGLALPYILVSVFPAVLKVFPKPGPWMVKLQKVMGILLLATVAWLLWVVNEQAGSAGVGIFAIVAAVAIAGSFIIGKIAPPGGVFGKEVAGFAGSIIVLAALWFGVLAPRYENVVDERFNARLSEQMTEDGWYRYSPALIEEFKAAGRTVFVDVSADWCLTCKANEAAILNREEFTHAMDSLKVARVKADWTRETPEVNALLKGMGKSGVPAYAIYPAGDASQQIVLPELLTTSGIVEKISGK